VVSLALRFGASSLRLICAPLSFPLLLQIVEKLYKEEGYPPMAIAKKDLDRLPPQLQPMFRFCRVAEREQASADQAQPSDYSCVSLLEDASS
jgi:hypothetical protein